MAEDANVALLKEGLAGFGLDPRPEAVAALFHHLDLVREWNERINLTAITSEREMVVKHVLDSGSGLQVARLEPGSQVLDVGTGAGFPGVVWKCLVPGIRLTLLESLQKRCRFLEEVGEAVVKPLAGEPTGYRVLWGRAEELGRVSEHREAYDVVTARAVAELRILAEYCLPFVKVGGLFLGMKGPAVSDEVEAARSAIEALGGKVEEISEFELLADGGRRSLVAVRKVRPTPKAYPRKAGTPAKHPL